MTPSTRYDRLVVVKEREKDVAKESYEQAKKKATEKLEQLYSLLKQKEVLEEGRRHELTKGISIDKMRHTQVFFEQLETGIAHVQKEVQQAQAQLHLREQNFQTQFREVKKFEKLRERSVTVERSERHRKENLLLDELATQSFMQRGTW
ncbi:flagellar export protein FliJ [Bacillus fonticola]|uniref:flagellar export protein FliJ n=1 Tax=Bacillus fonticola TaxID=2728853 RepID=UPI001474B24C|nr:flagellar export protein FliJ [Bacillus fonticola]